MKRKIVAPSVPYPYAHPEVEDEIKQSNSPTKITEAISFIEHRTNEESEVFITVNWGDCPIGHIYKEHDRAHGRPRYTTTDIHGCDLFMPSHNLNEIKEKFSISSKDLMKISLNAQREVDKEYTKLSEKQQVLRNMRMQNLKEKTLNR